ncbi:DoxX family membrane protein [Actinobacteria bacterium IMCC26103]|nr:DoxX family membrane protein [Actinobacteria bacterium IMCC26103]
MKEKFVIAQPWIGLFARLILGGVLFVAGYLKVSAPDKSQMAVRAYEMLPISFANVLGLVLPFAEVAMGALLILGSLTRVVAALGGFTMVIFIIAISQAWARGLNIDCGCFGGGGAVEPGQTKYLQEILRDAGLAFLAAYLIRYPVTKFSVDKKPIENTSQKDVA